ncbi:hypothetical protein OAW18_02445 [Alphaproteobacteria bacterium]|nr:hypothetical protein [Alphaproteobacteria bacterium]
MKISEGMPVSYVLAYLKQTYEASYFGQPRSHVVGLPNDRKLSSSMQPKQQSIKICEKTKFFVLANCCSIKQNRPIRFRHELVGLISPSWTIKELLDRVSHKRAFSTTDKTNMVIDLLVSAESFSDVDWILRVVKKHKPTYEIGFEERLSSAIKTNALFIGDEQKAALEAMILTEMICKN